jgi:hypothetical protein
MSKEYYKYIKYKNKYLNLKKISEQYSGSYHNYICIESLINNKINSKSVFMNNIVW